MIDAKLSNEDKARIFSLYLNLENPTIFTRIDDEDKTPLMLCGVNIFDEFVCLSDMDGGIYWEEPFDNVQLHLNPLSEISDEDAIEIGNILGYDKKRFEYGKWFIENISEPAMICSYVKAMTVIDFLRSKSYALPYKGINLFTAGIAINQPKTQ